MAGGVLNTSELNPASFLVFFDELRHIFHVCLYLCMFCLFVLIQFNHFTSFLCLASLLVGTVLGEKANERAVRVPLQKEGVTTHGLEGD